MKYKNILLTLSLSSASFLSHASDVDWCWFSGLSTQDIGTECGSALVSGPESSGRLSGLSVYGAVETLASQRRPMFTAECNMHTDSCSSSLTSNTLTKRAVIGYTAVDQYSWNGPRPSANTCIVRRIISWDSSMYMYADFVAPNTTPQGDQVNGGAYVNYTILNKNCADVVKDDLFLPLGEGGAGWALSNSSSNNKHMITSSSYTAFGPWWHAVPWSTIQFQVRMCIGPSDMTQSWGACTTSAIISGGVPPEVIQSSCFFSSNDIDFGSVGSSRGIYESQDFIEADCLDKNVYKLTIQNSNSVIADGTLKSSWSDGSSSIKYTLPLGTSRIPIKTVLSLNDGTKPGDYNATIVIVAEAQ